MTTLSEWMSKNSVSDTALAARVGVSRPFITRIRTGVRQPSVSVAAKLVEETGLPVDCFVKPGKGA